MSNGARATIAITTAAALLAFGLAIEQRVGDMEREARAQRTQAIRMAGQVEATGNLQRAVDRLSDRVHLLERLEAEQSGEPGDADSDATGIVWRGRPVKASELVWRGCGCDLCNRRAVQMALEYGTLK